MTEFHRWLQTLRVERTLAALRRNNFQAQWVEGAVEAREVLFGMIPQGATVGIGGSMSLSQIGFFEEAQKRGLKLLNPFLPGMAAEEALKIRREIMLADVFVSGCNAITEDGKLVNIDGTGNRVAAMIFGPKKVIVLCGINKIVKDLAEAQRRAQEWAAPLNARRLGIKTPCAETGQCTDCDSPQRICNIYTVLAKRPIRTEFEIILVGESLGL
jgi:hypothetical protein